MTSPIMVAFSAKYIFCPKTGVFPFTDLINDIFNFLKYLLKE
jgi:hypothetical protein